MKHVYEYIEGWYQFQKMPANTTHIAYLYENASVYLPEDGATYQDWADAVFGNHVHKLVRVDQLPEPPATMVVAADLIAAIEAAHAKHETEIVKG